MQAIANPSTAQTDAELIGAPAAGHQIVVTSIFVSSDTALTVTLESGTGTLKWRQYAGANGGHIANAGKGGRLFTCADAEALTLTTSDAGNVFVSVQAEIRRTFDLS